MLDINQRRSNYPYARNNGEYNILLMVQNRENLLLLATVIYVYEPIDEFKGDVDIYCILQ